MFSIEPALFSEDAVAAETRALNADIIAALEDAPDQWSLPHTVIRERRALGQGIYPLPPKSSRAETLSIDGPGGVIALRVIRPLGVAKGVYLHIHGGGWMYGAADQQDALLERVADRVGFAAVSVEYRLSPEHPFPAAPDDCLAAALWLSENARSEFQTEKLAIGGESAGAHLSVLTLLALRERHGLSPFQGANLVAGCFDLGLTPSARQFGDEKLILRTTDIENFVKRFLVCGTDRRAPHISPLYADLTGMPPALFSVGTRDALLDDSIFMAMRWLAAGNLCDLAIFPGGAHVFQAFAIPLAEESLQRIDAFLQSLA